MARNVLQLVATACYRSNIQTPPTALVGSSNAGDRQLLHLFYAVCEELRALRCWPQLKKTFKLRLVAGQDKYALPADFYSLLPFTQYEGSTPWLATGPMTDVGWNFRVKSYGLDSIERGFRLFGVGSQVQISPTPAASDAQTSISFDYVSKNFVLPPAWTASESVAQNTWRHADGILYKKLTASSHTGGAVKPTMAFAEGQTGSVRWLAFTPTAFATTTLYAPGDYFTAGGRLYRVTVGGTSGGSAPTSTTVNTDITTGSVTCRYHVASAWAGETAIAFGDYMLGAGSQYYRCTQGGITGKTEPLWSPTIENDNAIAWTFQDVAYEELVADTDICAFDDDLVIAGLRAKLFLARGLGANDLIIDYERMKKTAMGRWHAGKVLDLAAGCQDGVAYPTINWVGANWVIG